MLRNNTTGLLGQRKAQFGGLVFEIGDLALAKAILFLLGRDVDIGDLGEPHGVHNLQSRTSSYFYSLAWSHDGSALAAIMRDSSGPSIVVVDVNTGQVLARLQAPLESASSDIFAEWSPDDRDLVTYVRPESSLSLSYGTMLVWDFTTSQYQALPGDGWVWSPDGKWLAVAHPEEQSGVLLVTPDMDGSYALAGYAKLHRSGLEANPLTQIHILPVSKDAPTSTVRRLD